MRQIAKSLLKGDYQAYLAAPDKEYFEEIMLEGILIATAPLPEPERFDYLENFVPKISDWCVCDTICNSFRKTLPSQISKEAMWNFILEYQTSPSEFELRFMLVMILNHFIETAYLPEIFRLLDHLGETYSKKGLPHYTSMAAAWLLAEIIAKERNAAFLYLKTSKLPAQTFNKAIQKACESYRVAPVDKTLLRQLKY